MIETMTRKLKDNAQNSECHYKGYSKKIKTDNSPQYLDIITLFINIDVP
jgi:hypothetical protein